MWSKPLAECARQFESAVLTQLDADGYPRSVRCTVTLDDTAEIVRLTRVPAWAADWRGPAGLLFHRHNRELEGQHQMGIRGDLQAEGDTLVLRPAAFVTANGRDDNDELPHAGTPLQLIKFNLLGRKKAREYMAKRGKPWPAIPFAEMLRRVDTPATSPTSK